MNRELVWRTPLEGREWAKDFVKDLHRPCVVLLDGPLGAGKTQTVKWLLEAMGVKDSASPTFAIHHEYPSSSGVIDHVDLYRLKSDADLESSGFWDLFLKSDGLVFVEWSDRLPDSVWPSKWRRIRIRLDVGTGGERRVTVETV